MEREVVTYHENKRINCSFKLNQNGKLDGKFMKYDDKGELISFLNFDNGRLHGESRVMIDNKMISFMFNKNKKVDPSIDDEVLELVRICNSLLGKNE